MLCNNFYTALAPLMARYEQVCVVYDQKVRPVVSATNGLTVFPCLEMEVDERNKSLETVSKVWDFFFAQNLSRRGLVVVIGGGVLTDLVGFAAATYKRGVDCIHIPTTLLSMVDASSGGKTGFNYHGLKNSIGVFAQPVETIISPEWLSTLPAQQFLSGFGEMLKSGLVDERVSGLEDERLWDRLMQYDLETMPIEPLVPLIEACMAVKRCIVAADPKEDGLRKVLNFGHTFGHALEEFSIQHSAFSIQHGYAVVYGLIAELYLSVTRLGCSREPLQQLTQMMLHYYGKPQCKCSDRESLIALMQQDKKNERAAQINCTLLRKIGEPVINQVISSKEAEEALDYLFSL